MSSTKLSHGQGLPVSGLCTAENVLVTVLRLWIENRLGQDDNCRWRTGLLSAGLAEDVSSAFDSAMIVTTISLCHPLEIRGHGHMLISEDEHRILNIIDLLQQNSFTGAGYVLSRWLPPAAVREVMPMFHKLATAMVHRGLKLPGRSHYEVFHRAANHQRRSAHIEPSATIH